MGIKVLNDLNPTEANFESQLLSSLLPFPSISGVLLLYYQLQDVKCSVNFEN